MEFKSFKLKIENYIAHLSFNRPEKANSLDIAAWEEMQSAFEYLDREPSVRVIILSGEGKHFCAGIDLTVLMAIQNQSTSSCEAHKRDSIRQFILKIQKTITSIEKCRKPVLAAIHNGCIGGGVDIVTAADMRYCTEDAYFTIKEVDLGLVADIGTLQRLPTIINPGIMAELAYTGRKCLGPEAKSIGIVNQTYSSKEEMIKGVSKIATLIAEKSPLVIRGIKEMLLYKRDHSVNDSLENMANYNAAMLLSNDLMESFQAHVEKRKPAYKE
jgi:enoyl-CoA hydratase